MLRRFVTGGLLALGLSLQAFSAEVIVKVRPPHAIVETRPVRPAPDYVWVDGYHRWDGRAYVWERGRWERPPRRHARWVAHHWVHRHGGWVLVEGHWR